MTHVCNNCTSYYMYYISVIYKKKTLCSSSTEIVHYTSATPGKKPTVTQNKLVSSARMPWWKSGHISRDWLGVGASGDTAATHYQNSIGCAMLEQHHGSVTIHPCKIYPHSLNCVVLTRGSGDKFPTSSVSKLFVSNGLQQGFIYGALTCHTDPFIATTDRQPFFPLACYSGECAGWTFGQISHDQSKERQGRWKLRIF